jgi:hypothetical protein
VAVSRSFRRGALAGAAVVALAASVAACGDGSSSESEQVKPNYSAGQVGAIEVQNVTVIVDQSSQTALVTGTVLNSGDGADALDGVSVGGHSASLYRLAATDIGGGIQIGDNAATAASTLALPAGGSVQLGGTGTAVATATGGGLQLGSFTPVTFQFGSAGVLTLQALVEPNSGIYSSYTAPATGTATATASSSGTATGTASATVTATGTSTSTSTPTGSATPATTGTPTK